MSLDGLALLDEGVVGAGQAALHDVAHDGSPELGAQAGGGSAEHVAGGEHFDRSRVERLLAAGVVVVFLNRWSMWESEVFGELGEWSKAMIRSFSG